MQANIYLAIFALVLIAIAGYLVFFRFGRK